NPRTTPEHSDPVRRLGSVLDFSPSVIPVKTGIRRLLFLPAPHVITGRATNPSLLATPSAFSYHFAII
ncbi:MAG: hypothetical protein OXL95_04485, partial [Nitrospira sp.]|nr:hypothetical protein [Nitrospira sp.]